MSRQKPFTDELCYEKEDTIFTVSVQEDTAANLEFIEQVELPQVGELVDHETVVGTLETDQGTIDLYSPVDGEIVEVNDLVLEDPSIIIEDPSEGWLFRVESDEDPADYEQKRSKGVDDDDDFAEDDEEEEFDEEEELESEEEE